MGGDGKEEVQKEEAQEDRDEARTAAEEGDEAQQGEKAGQAKEGERVA
jgi:hypothetical protein